MKYTEQELAAIKLGDEAKIALVFWERFLGDAWNGAVEDIVDSQEDEVTVRERAAFKLKLLKGFKDYLLSLIGEAETIAELAESEGETPE